MRKIVAVCVWVIVGTRLGGEARALMIMGQVVDMKARPVEGAEVVVCEQFYFCSLEREAKTISPIVKTDSQGRYALKVDPMLDGDPYRQRNVFVVARKPGLACAWEWLNCTWNTVVLKHIPLVLEEPSLLSGQVVDAGGKPVVGAEIQAIPVTTSGFSGVIHLWPVFGPREWFTVRADPQGRFRFDQLAADVSAELRVQARGGESRYAFQKDAVDGHGYEAGRSDVQLSLPREGTIKGRVVSDHDQPVTGIDLLVQSGRERGDVTNLYVARKARSDAEGVFTFSCLPEGPHQVEVLAPEQGPDVWVARRTKVSVKAAEVAETTIHLEPGTELEVTALDAETGRPVPGAYVSPASWDWSRGRDAITDARGVAIQRVLPGTYIVCVGLPGRYSSWRSTEEIPVKQPIRFEASLAPSSKVSGRVVDPEGRPVRDALVVPCYGDHVLSDANGQFVANLDEASARVEGWITARDPGRGLACVAPKRGAGPIELRLGPAWTLTGRVADANGLGIPAARVNLDTYVSVSHGRLDVLVTTDSQGRFRMEAIPPVQRSFGYSLSVYASGFGPYEYNRIRPEGAAGTTVDIGAVNLLPASESVFGVVVDANGAPARRAAIGTSDGGRGEVRQPHRSTGTDDQGRFTFTRLCRGPVRLQVTSDSGYGHESASVDVQAPCGPIKIMLGKNAVQVPEISILGRAMPSLAGLSKDLAEAQTGGSPVLVCLCDLEQRPSRQCLVELAKQADKLAAKGIRVIVVQTSKIDLRQFDDFIKANGITASELGKPL